MGVSSFPPAAAASGGKTKKVVSFTSSGTWTVPANVNYAIAEVRGGGGGVGHTSPGNGGNSIVAFSSTVTGSGAGGFEYSINLFGQNAGSRSGTANSGEGAHGGGYNNNWMGGMSFFASSAPMIKGQSDVTPGSSVPVTVGAGGIAGSNGSAGGSGYVTIEYYE